MCLILDKEGRFYKTNMRGAYLDVFWKICIRQIDEIA